MYISFHIKQNRKGLFFSQQLTVSLIFKFPFVISFSFLNISKSTTGSLEIFFNSIPQRLGASDPELYCSMYLYCFVQATYRVCSLTVDYSYCRLRVRTISSSPEFLLAIPWSNARRGLRGDKSPNSWEAMTWRCHFFSGFFLTSHPMD